MVFDPRYMKALDVAKRYGLAKEQIDGFINQRQHNGLADAIRKIHLTYYFNIEKWEKWIADYVSVHKPSTKR